MPLLAQKPLKVPLRGLGGFRDGSYSTGVNVIQSIWRENFAFEEAAGSMITILKSWAAVSVNSISSYSVEVYTPGRALVIFV